MSDDNGSQGNNSQQSNSNADKPQSYGTQIIKKGEDGKNTTIIRK